LKICLAITEMMKIVEAIGKGEDKKLLYMLSSFL
jgi:hypothetical protein